MSKNKKHKGSNTTGVGYNLPCSFLLVIKNIMMKEKMKEE